MASTAIVGGCAYHSPAGTLASDGKVIADDGGEYCTGVARPPWVPKPNMEHPDFIYATGTALQATSRREGRVMAFQQGAAQITKGLCGDVQLKQDYLEAEYCERHGEGIDYYTLVALPRARYEALQRQCAHNVIIGGLCPQCPDSGWLADIAQTVSLNGQNLASTRLSPAEITRLLQNGDATAVAIGKTRNASVAVVVTLTPEKQLVEDDVQYMYLKAEVRIIDLQSGAETHTFAVGAVKGAAFDTAGAWKKALQLMAKELRNRFADIRI